MPKPLEGKTVLVTGAARRIGREIALALAGAGADVVVHHRRSQAAAKALAEEIRSAGGRAWAVRANLADEAECEVLVERAREAAGRLDLLVNNAAIFPESRVASVTMTELDRAVRINAWAPFVLSRRFAERAPEGAAIVNVLDTRVRGLDRGHVAYHASKSLLAVFTRLMAVEYAPRIRVCAVAPGPILPADGETPDAFEAATAAVPLRRCGTARDVADAVVFLAGASYVTGQVIYVDGGRHVRDGVAPEPGGRK
jgi:pteridine reductase